MEMVEFPVVILVFRGVTLHSRKLTWNLKIICLKRKIIFQTSFFGFHVTVVFGGVMKIQEF